MHTALLHFSPARKAPVDRLRLVVGLLLLRLWRVGL
jgi:hypothetical protein